MLSYRAFLRLSRRPTGFRSDPRYLTADMSAPTSELNGASAQQSRKRGFNEGRRHFKQNKKQKKDTRVKEGSNEDVLLADVKSLLAKCSIRPSENAETPGDSNQSLSEPFTEVDLTISELSSTGDGLAQIPNTSQVAVVPFTAPGDVVTAKIIKHLQDQSYTLTDFVKVIKPSQHRDDTLVQCPYFSTCSGCQFQMLPYSYQLDHKKTIVEKAYKNFCNLPTASIPAIGDTIGSPLQYGYRTKLTPHFDGPPGARRERRAGHKPAWEEVPPIGFMKKGTRKTLDIEDCPIGTDAVRKGLKRERLRVKEELDKYQRGATLLCRESTQRVEKDEAQNGDGHPAKEADTTEQAAAPVHISKEEDDVVIEDLGKHIHRKTCITDQNAVSTEYVDDFRFENPAGSFFQNNNSILPPFTQYIRDHILPKAQSPDTTKITNLIDAYSGSGLFTVTLSSLFNKSIGIDVSASSIKFASRNAELNNLESSSARFLAGDANDIFASIQFPAEETAVVIDPSRKGCDENFLSQLLRFGPARVCYVSCNVHTQARDVGMLVGGIPGVNNGEGLYDIESLRGFDFFPQTGHVEGVAILNKRVSVEKSQ